MKWILIKPLKNSRIIEDYQQQIKLKLPLDYIEVVKKYNGASPELTTFDSENTDGLVFNRLLSFNEKDIDNIFKATECLKDSAIVPFANDGFGNFLVFKSNDLTIHFYNYEEESLEYISETFTDLLKKLYE